MPRFIIDELNRLDAPLSVFFTRQLELIRPGAEEIVYPELMGRTLVPVKNDIPNGVEEYTYRVYDRVGRAAWVRDQADDFPRVDVFGREETAYFKNFGDSYGWSVQEMRNAQQGGYPLDARKPTQHAGDRAILRCRRMLIGDSEVKIKGHVHPANVWHGCSPELHPGGLSGYAWLHRVFRQVCLRDSGRPSRHLACAMGAEQSCGAGGHPRPTRLSVRSAHHSSR